MTAPNKSLQHRRVATRRTAASIRLMRFAKRVKALRQRRGLSRSGFADLLGITYSNTSNIEMGHNWPSVPVYRKICEVLLGSKPPLL